MNRAGRKGARRLLLCCALLAGGLGISRFVHAHARATSTQVAGPGGALRGDVDSEGSAGPTRTLREGTSAQRVLIIGNSYSMFHELHSLVQHVADGVVNGPKLVVETQTRGGFSLRNHLKTGQALAKIRSGRYHYVVLQGHSLSALDHPDELATDAERFKHAIDAVSARTVLYATWARSPEAPIYRHHKVIHSFAEMTDRVDTTYAGISRRLGAGLAPVGRAFERALVQAPRLALWGADGSHPTLAGSFMAACVLYGAITHADPRDSRYVPAGLTESQAALLRRVADQSLNAASNLVGLQPSAPSVGERLEPALSSLQP